MLYDSNGRFTIALVNSRYGRFTFAFLILRPGFQEPSIRKNTIAIINFVKHKAEGKLEERKVILGWLVDTRRFRIYLTEEKARDWLVDIDSTITTKKCSKKTHVPLLLCTGAMQVLVQPQLLRKVCHIIAKAIAAEMSRKTERKWFVSSSSSSCSFQVIKVFRMQLSPVMMNQNMEPI